MYLMLYLKNVSMFRMTFNHSGSSVLVAKYKRPQAKRPAIPYVHFLASNKLNVTPTARQKAAVEGSCP